MGLLIMAMMNTFPDCFGPPYTAACYNPKTPENGCTLDFPGLLVNTWPQRHMGIGTSDSGVCQCAAKRRIFFSSPRDQERKKNHNRKTLGGGEQH